MIVNSEYYTKMSSQCNEAMDLLLKRPWDPMTAVTTRTKLVKLIISLSMYSVRKVLWDTGISKTSC